MRRLQLLVPAAWVVLFAVTWRAAAELGFGGGNAFFTDFSHPSRAQFNTDLSLQLVLFAVWVSRGDPYDVSTSRWTKRAWRPRGTRPARPAPAPLDPSLRATRLSQPAGGTPSAGGLRRRDHETQPASSSGRVRDIPRPKAQTRRRRQCGATPKSCALLSLRSRCAERGVTRAYSCAWTSNASSSSPSTRAARTIRSCCPSRPGRQSIRARPVATFRARSCATRAGSPAF